MRLLALAFIVTLNTVWALPAFALPTCSIKIEGDTQYIPVYFDGEEYNTEGIGKMVGKREYKPIVFFSSKEALSAYQAEQDVINECYLKTNMTKEQCFHLVSCNVPRYFKN